MVRRTIAPFAALLVLVAPAAMAGGADFYGVTVTYASPFSGTWTASPQLVCTQSPVPSPEIEVRCNSTTFGATVCKSPAASGDVVGWRATLIVRSICGAGAQADCTATTPALGLAGACSDEEPTLGSSLPFVCHVVPSGAVIRYEAQCKAYFG